jgi:hypothetical protein
MKNHQIWSPYARVMTVFRDDLQLRFLEEPKTKSDGKKQKVWWQRSMERSLEWCGELGRCIWWWKLITKMNPSTGWNKNDSNKMILTKKKVVKVAARVSQKGHDCTKTRTKPATKTRTQTETQHYGLWKRIMQKAKHGVGRGFFFVCGL